MNGDLAGSRKSSLLVEDFIKVDVLLVKVCHKRRKVNCFELRLREKYFSLSPISKKKLACKKPGV